MNFYLVKDINYIESIFDNIDSLKSLLLTIDEKYNDVIEYYQNMIKYNEEILKYCIVEV